MPEGKIPAGIEIVPLAAGGTVAQTIKPALLVYRTIVCNGAVVKVVLIDLPDGIERVVFVKVIVNAKPGAWAGILLL